MSKISLKKSLTMVIFLRFRLNMQRILLLDLHVSMEGELELLPIILHISQVHLMLIHQTKEQDS